MGRQHTVRQASRQPRRHTQQQTASQLRVASDQNLVDQRRKIFPPEFNSSSQGEPNRLLFAARLIQRYPWLIWLVALSMVMGSATAAITTILNPDASIPYSSSIAVGSSPPAPARASRLERLPAPNPLSSTLPANATHAGTDAATPPKSLRSGSNQLNQPSASPQSAVAAVGLSCAAGCFLLSQWLKPRPKRRRILFESQSPSSAKQIQRSNGQVQAETLSVETITPVVAPALPQLPIASTISFDLNPAISQSPETSPAETAEATIVPAEQSHPLDWDAPSLADSLDLRQRRPLSYWLQTSPNQVNRL